MSTEFSIGDVVQVTAERLSAFTPSARHVIDKYKNVDHVILDIRILVTGEPIYKLADENPDIGYCALKRCPSEWVASSLTFIRQGESAISCFCHPGKEFLPSCFDCVEILYP